MVRLDATAVRALAASVLAGADRLDEIHWPSMPSDDMPGSAVIRAAESPMIEDRLADVVARMRTWAAAAQASVAALQQTELLHANRLGESR